jgi:hypothetical protein
VYTIFKPILYVFSRDTAPVRISPLSLAREPSKKGRANGQKPWLVGLREPEFDVELALKTLNSALPPLLYYTNNYVEK